MRSLEQSVLPSGRPKIAAPPGQHDDYATAFLALAAYLHAGPRIYNQFSIVA